MNARRILLIGMTVLLLIPAALFAAGEEHLLESYAFDIAYSTLQELRAWTERLGLRSDLPPSGLRKELYTHYGIDQGEYQLSSGDESVLKVTITHADTVSYESYIRLSGNVSVTISDSQSGSETSLSADTVILDNDRKQLTAIGTVRIEALRDKEQTLYTADTILIGYEDMDGIFSNAVTRSDRVNSEEDTIEFYLTGKRVDLKDGTMLLEESFLTSDVDNSYYGLRAARMKALPDGDWFLEHAVLTLGRVPILYLPFFFYPSNTFAFHPSFGYDTDRGWFLNTSTSLLGDGLEKPDGEESSFSSFMRMRDIATTPYTSFDGMILTYQDEPQNDLQEWAHDTDSFVNLYADVFGDTGLQVTLDSQFKELLFVDELSLYTGAGYAGSSDLRYLTELSAAIDQDHLDFSLEMPLYSDPDVRRDLLTRKSYFKLDDIFSRDAFTQSFSDVDDYSWTLEADGSWEVKAISPYIRKITLSSLDAEISWDDYDTTTKEYVIDSVVLPDGSLTVTGTLLDLSFGEAQAAEEDSPGKQDLGDYTLDFSPAPTSREEPAETVEEQLLPDREADARLPSATLELTPQTSVPLGISLGYEIKELYKNQLFFDSADLSYQDVDQRVSGELDLGLELFEELLSFSGTFSPVFDIEHRNSFVDTVDPYHEEDTFLIGDLKVSSRILDLSYQYSSYLYNTDPDDETVLKHRLSLSQRVGEDERYLKLSLRWDLPPLDSVITPSVSLRYGSSDLSLSTAVSYDDLLGTYELDPISVKYGYTFDNGSKVSLTYDHDLDVLADSMLTAAHTISLGEDLSLSGGWYFDIYEDLFDSGWARLTYEKAYASFWFENILTPTAYFDTGLSLTKFKVDTGEISFFQRAWKDRIGIEAGFESSWYLDLTDFYDNSLDFRFFCNFSIAEFLDLTFSSTSKNSATYTYFPAFNDGTTPGFLEDLLLSFNFFNRDDRLASNFNLDSLQVGIVHYMKDWDIHADIIGGIGYNDTKSTWEWQPKVSFYVQWKAIPELDFQTSVEKDDDDTFTLDVK